MPRVAVEELTARVSAIFRAKGCAADEARDIATSLVGANLTGHDSHGVVRVPRYVAWMDEDVLRAGQGLTIVSDGGAFVVADGGQGFGQTLGRHIVDLGVARAAAHGVCVTALRRAGHLGRIGEWAERAAEHGIVSIHCVNVHGSVLVAPFGAMEKRFSTAPFAVGVPMGEAPALILDFATSKVAEGKVLNAITGGKALPPACIIAPDGHLSHDPADFYGTSDPTQVPAAVTAPGALVAMGDHKGSGLAFMMEVLGGALTGGGTCGPDKTPVLNGMLSVFLDPARLDPANDFAAEVQRFTDWVRSARPRPDIESVEAPGDTERRLAAERRDNGVPLPAEAWRAIQATAQAVGAA